LPVMVRRNIGVAAKNVSEGHLARRTPGFFATTGVVLKGPEAPNQGAVKPILALARIGTGRAIARGGESGRPRDRQGRRAVLILVFVRCVADYMLAIIVSSLARTARNYLMTKI